MLNKLKNILFFPFASYFKFFARFRLKRWNPRVIVVTGSSGKTTLLHLLESQLGRKGKYSFKANSAFGIPFDILNLKRNNFAPLEWPLLFLRTPFKVFNEMPKEEFYVVEADTDRPGEGKFLASLLKPEATLWLNASRTHSMNFEKLVQSGKQPNLEKAISNDFGFFAQHTTGLVVANVESKGVLSEISRINCDLKKVSCRKSLKKYNISNYETNYIIDEEKYHFNFLLPKEFCTSILMSKYLMEYLKLPFDKSFSRFNPPNGRSSVFKGIRHTVLIDSTYNANLGSMKAVLNMFQKIKGEKWVVLGDMLEQGKNEEAEHLRLAKIIAKYSYSKIILMGPRMSKYTYPFLQKNVNKSVELVKYEYPKEVLDYLLMNIKGSEIILFKGARFLEGVVENLLGNSSDATKLIRREKIWAKRRKNWGL